MGQKGSGAHCVCTVRAPCIFFFHNLPDPMVLLCSCPMRCLVAELVPDFTLHALRTRLYMGNAVQAAQSFGCRQILGPYFWPLLTSFWFHTGVFFNFLCIWDVPHLNCHPLLPIFNHFYPFFIPHIEVSPLWGPPLLATLHKPN